MQLWEQFLQQQEAELGVETVQKWLRSLVVQRYDACNLYLQAKDSFQILWFEEHVRSKILQKFINGNNKRIKVHITIGNSTKNSENVKKEKSRKKEENSFPFKLIFDELDPFCTFSNFVINDENRLPFNLLTEIAGLPSEKRHQTPLGTFNPIYLYGHSGSGKTHLLMSLTQALQEKGLKAIYVRAERFTDHVVSAIRAGEMSIFRQAYRNADILLVDDVHIFSRKGATQEEFFHTFNTLHLEGKQIVLTANCAPQELQLIEARLISRFEWGIVLPLRSLAREELSQMLELKSKSLKFPLPQKISDFLIETFISNSKALMKAIEALILRLHLDDNHSIQMLTAHDVKSLLSDLIIEEQKSALTPPKIIQAVAEQYGIRTDDILGKGQSRECSLPRQLAMFLCRQQLNLPYMKIGEIFSRDHSTVMSGIKQTQKAIDNYNRDVTSAYNAILKKIS